MAGTKSCERARNDEPPQSPGSEVQYIQHSIANQSFLPHRGTMSAHAHGRLLDPPGGCSCRKGIIGQLRRGTALPEQASIHSIYAWMYL